MSRTREFTITFLQERINKCDKITEKMRLLFAPFIKSSQIVFKKCFDSKTEDIYILALEKQEMEFDSNEFRVKLSHPNRNFKKFRCNGLIPRLIYNTSKAQVEDFVLHTTFLHCYGYRHRIDTLYKLHHLVKPNEFTPSRKSCAPGIHYFLTLQAACNYDLYSGTTYDYQSELLKRQKMSESEMVDSALQVQLPEILVIQPSVSYENDSSVKNKSD